MSESALQKCGTGICTLCGTRDGGILATALAVLIFFQGCALVGPDYQEPATPSPTAWHTDLKGGLTPAVADPRALAEWWTLLKDPLLDDLVEQGIEGNLDAREARARVREARARRRAAAAPLFPSVDAAGSVTRSRSSENRGGGDGVTLYSVGLDASWEWDLFGGTRRAVEAATADLEASRADLRDVLVTLLAEIALNYVDVRTYQARIRVAEENLAAQEDTYTLARARLEAGLTDELAVEQSRYNLESTRSQIPLLRTGLAAAMNRLAVLTGRAPGALNAGLETPQPIPVAPAETAVGIPAETLRRRPDVQSAERRLAAQTARIGVATADLYPKFRLLGSIGLESLSTGQLLDASALARSVASNLGWTLFDAGTVRGNIEIQSALQEQTLQQYESTVLGALEEVENALRAYQDERERRRTLVLAATAARNAVELSRVRYRAGLTDFVSVLEAERSRLSFEDQLAQSTGNLTAGIVRLYKALGGGWHAESGEVEAGDALHES